MNAAARKELENFYELLRAMGKDGAPFLDYFKTHWDPKVGKLCLSSNCISHNTQIYYCLLMEAVSFHGELILMMVRGEGEVGRLLFEICVAIF